MKYKDVYGRIAEYSFKKFIYFYIYCICHQIKYKVHVLDTKKSMQILFDSKKSIARFGDGEMALIMGQSIPYQVYHPALSRRLKEILSSEQKKCLIGLPYSLGNLCVRTMAEVIFCNEHFHEMRKHWVKFVDRNQTYCTTDITRPYIGISDKRKAASRFECFKKFWNGKKVLIVEGEGTRFGIGNNLLVGAAEIKRILCPAENAFEKYEEILQAVSQYDQDFLILIALGPTATVLAYDLSNLGSGE